MPFHLRIWHAQFTILHYLGQGQGQGQIPLSHGENVARVVCVSSSENFLVYTDLWSIIKTMI